MSSLELSSIEASLEAPPAGFERLPAPPKTSGILLGRLEAQPEQPLRLLHVEDEPNDALLCQLQLEEAGFQVASHVVASKEAFSAALETSEFDIVLTDYRLPGWSGFDVLRTLRADGRDIPCILLTGSVGEEIAAKCIKQGATDYILKDRPARLPFAIRSALQEKEQRAHRIEAELGRKRLASIVESSLDAIIGASQDGRIVDWNPAAARTFGYSAAEVCGTPLTNLFWRESETGVAPIIQPGAGGAIQSYEAKGTKQNGEVMDLNVTISPILNADGSSAGISAIVRDVTEEKRLQKELLTNQKLEAIGQLAGGVAHDFNNLLTVINGYAQMLLKKGVADPAKLDAILQAGERGQKLTKQLLVFSRKQITQFKHLNLNSLVTGFMDMLRPLIGADIELRTIFHPSLPAVLADSGQMEQVIMNLVVNARDAMPEGGVITIETSHCLKNGAPGTVVLSVTDTGVGMPKEVQARIFEPFFTTKEVGRGTGLGLSTSSGIIARCHGTLRVTSTVGQGTTFWIELPACTPPPAEAEIAPPLATVDKPVSGTILLAEDDPTVRGFVVATLKERGYNVLAAENGVKALALAASHAGPIDALVTDVVMPEMNGRTLAERVRLLRPHLKVLFVSGYIDHGLKDEDLSKAEYAFMEKPFAGEKLLETLSELCTGAPR